MRLFLSSLTLCVLLSQSINTFAQFEGIDLNNYKLTDYKYKALSTNLNFANQNHYQRTNSNSNYNFINSGGSLNFSSTKHTRNYIGIYNIWTSMSNNYINRDFSPNKSTEKTTNFSFQINANNKFYISNDYFYAINFDMYQNPSHSYTKTTSPFSTTQSELKNIVNVDNTLSFQFGKGRIENVSDSRLAIYILDDLVKQGRLSRVPNQEEVFAFADFITKILNNRVIDLRNKRIKEYVAIDSFLTSNGLANKTDGLYFGLINDNWQYARSSSWESGSIWYIGVSPALDYSNQFSKNITDGVVTKYEEKYTKYLLSFQAEYTSAKISGLKWQKGFDIWGSFDLFSYKGNNTNFQKINGYTSYYLTYVPNTRTSISGRSGINAYKYLNKDINESVQISPFLSGNCNYYFSEKLQLQFNASINYTYSKYSGLLTTYKALYLTVNAALKYNIF